MKEENLVNKGKLKIFLGYAAGVGKTYAMLQSAHDLKLNGEDVVIGYVEPHDRPETSKLVDGLEMIPPCISKYKGITLKEFDIDAALKRKPGVILVDELAHTNSPNSRNKKRYQDVAELLQAGINVFTTVNVQHLESLNDIIERITGVQVNERVPDDVFNGAENIELIDIEPQELLQRLNEGKVYQKNRAKYAMQNFFTEEKLIALREIALRKTADLVNDSALRQGKNKNSPLSREHVLVCVSSSPSSPHVIRAASRLAFAFKAEFTALYVGKSEREISEAAEARLSKNLRLAEQLGAKLSVIYGENLPQQISDYARVSHASKLVIGKSPDKNAWNKTNVVDYVSKQVNNLEIYIIPTPQRPTDKSHKKILQKLKFRFTFSDLFKTILLLIGITLLGLLFNTWDIRPENIIIIYILGVQVTAICTKGRIFSVLSSISSVLLFNYFFTYPYNTFEVFDPVYPITFIIMLAAGLITSTLTNRIQEQKKVLTEKSYRTEALLEANQEFAKGESISDILETTAIQVKNLLDRDVVIYPVLNGALAKANYYPYANSERTLEDYLSYKEKGVAEWVMYNNKRAGATTNTLSASKYLYLSIRRKNRVFAIIGLLMMGREELDSFEKSITFAMLGESALALEREFLREEQQEIEAKMQHEQLRASLLRSISHDLRTPLTGISGHARLLMEKANSLDSNKINELSTFIYDDSLWLINLVENLLSITRLENKVELKLSINVMSEVVEEALKHVDRHLVDHNFKLTLSEEVLTVNVDASLLIQVIVNIINNAIKYTPKGTTIQLSTSLSHHKVIVEISDEGPGLDDESKAKIFDMFYTNGSHTADSKRGLGLGLYLCRIIILAHGGEIYVRDNHPTGLIIGFSLPETEVKINE